MRCEIVNIIKTGLKSIYGLSKNSIDLYSDWSALTTGLLVPSGIRMRHVVNIIFLRCPYPGNAHLELSFTITSIV